MINLCNVFVLNINTLKSEERAGGGAGNLKQRNQERTIHATKCYDSDSNM